ncbi:hypothetical protein llap_8641 [Limosa lapponica baueri]|uniref:Uncharacterized protein n=1 Tax=Limosa lapponica baueri TaxID=1758121 RepID=A0A2I0U4Z8_LIMLA|nr:hypothetical protein llap_8641 [Limosa lapponica baueri]
MSAVQRQRHHWPGRCEMLCSHPAPSLGGNKETNHIIVEALTGEDLWRTPNPISCLIQDCHQHDIRVSGKIVIAHPRVPELTRQGLAAYSAGIECGYMSL